MLKNNITDIHFNHLDINYDKSASTNKLQTLT